MFGYEVLQSYNELEMLVYNYIMDHKEEVKFMTIRELSDAVHVSTSTIIRFCKKTGCDGYSEFRVRFKLFLKEEQENHKKVLKDNVGDEIMYFLHNVTSTEYEESIVKVTEMIQKARQLIFIGIGTSGILGKYGARYFSNIGKFSQYIEDPYFPIGNDIEGTAVIALSESGETQQTLRLAERLKRHNCKIFSITNGLSCTLAKMSDYNLAYFVPKQMVQGEYNITTQVPVIYLLETIGRRLS
ncbi:MAG: MurR/RpiR family transcriptional regulator [Lachnospiraceae bacterium]|jgi:DNA-binding MurR/RpiR family transcriptional regulator|nr:MurR/RpiR family transcriptional regulator [Lachnospiraceae bacterium]